MTVAHSIPAATTVPANRPTGRVRESLEPVHRDWLSDLQSAIRAAEQRHSDILSRWRAIRYLDTVFAPRFERERRDIDRLALALGAGQQEQLWAAGELVALSLWQMGHAVGLCHDAAGFARMSGTLVKAAVYWFGMAEAIAGPMSWDDVPVGARQDLVSLGHAITPG